MPERSKLLIKHGFIKKEFSDFYYFDPEKKVYLPKEGVSLDPGHADEEEFEEYENQYLRTGFPRCLKHYKLVWEMYHIAMEGPYYFVLKHINTDSNYPEIIKTEDTFSASESSSFFGVIEQRKGLQQEKITQFLATIGKMVKDLFQLVRELRIIDERLTYYQGTEKELEKPLEERKKSDEITLKGIFVDLVQGGAKNPASIYGMARELEFTTLPDLFFDAPPLKSNEVDPYVDKLEENFNRKVCEVLRRHLKQFIIWKEHTSKEIKVRRKFVLQYLRQHWAVIKMYMEWTKPYLRNVERMEMKEKHLTSADIVSAFEGGLIDIEFLAKKNFGSCNAVVLASFNYRTSPQMKFVGEGYQRGPIHLGKVEISLRAYAWTDEQINNYLELKKKEGLALLGSIDASIKSAMETLGDELVKYLEEAGHKEETEKKEEKKLRVKEGLFRKMFRDFLPEKEIKLEKKKKEKRISLSDKKSAENDAKEAAWNTFKNFKKAHGMLAW